jgi:2-polyprenyl-6-methoxyphenol hydroxylase-like FAD-dependent oxidoreductase
LDYDVIIAGAGPVGLFLACELRLAQLSVLVLEALEDPSSPLKRMPFGMRGLWGPSVEAFHRRGLLDEVASHARAAGPKPGAMTERRGPAGHFAGIQFDYANVDASRWSYRLPGPSDRQVGCAMEDLERVLSARALSLGAEIRRGHGVESFEASDEDVVVRAAQEPFRARFLVGCDGGRSTVRKHAGFAFEGTDPEFTGYSIQADLEGAELPLGRHYTSKGVFTQWQPGVLAVVDFDGGAFHRTQPITREHVQGVLRRVTCTEVGVRAVHIAATWTDRANQATTYRKGRVLLAGDSAHVHSPLGGQGLNLGLGDAMNLGWKLAAAVRGDAPEGLLDSYTAERHPIGARILDWTRAQVSLMRPSRHARAMEAIVRDLLQTRDGATYFAERLWGVSLRYDLGGDHPLVGRSSPDFELADGTRLGELLREGNGVLLDFDRALGALSNRWGDRVRTVAGDAKDRLGLSAVLVRPDGFVAWASDAAPDPSDVRRAAARWFRERSA